MEAKGFSEQKCQCPLSRQSNCMLVIMDFMNCHPLSAVVIDPLQLVHHTRQKDDLARRRGTGGKWMFHDYLVLEATSLHRMRRVREILRVPAGQGPRLGASLQVGCRRRARAGNDRGAHSVDQGGQHLQICHLAMKVTLIGGGPTAVTYHPGAIHPGRHPRRPKGLEKETDV